MLTKKKKSADEKKRSGENIEPVAKKSKMMKNPFIDTTFLPDREVFHFFSFFFF